jgi:hypothetical protein
VFNPRNGSIYFIARPRTIGHGEERLFRHGEELATWQSMAVHHRHMDRFVPRDDE